MIDIQQSDKWNENRQNTDGGGDFDPCIVCGKHVKNPKHHVRLFWGYTAVTQAEANVIIAEQGEGGDMNYYPVGANCLRKHPELKPYVADAKRAMSELED